jgi:hypothetical protein
MESEASLQYPQALANGAYLEPKDSRSYSISLKPTLILSSRVYLDLPNGLSLHMDILTNLFCILIFPYVLHAQPISKCPLKHFITSRSWRTTLCHLSATACSVSSLPIIFNGDFNNRISLQPFVTHTGIRIYKHTYTH